MPLSRSTARPNPLQPVLNVPAYFLYGEDWTVATFGFFHMETQSARNEPNNWQIGLHTHPDFDQLSINFTGECAFEHDGKRRHVAAPCCVFTPAKVVHQFKYSPGSHGYVISVSPDFTESLTLGDGAAKTALQRLTNIRLIEFGSRESASALERLATLMIECFESDEQHRRETLRHLFAAFLLQIDSVNRGPWKAVAEHAASNVAGDDLFQRFSESVEREIGELGLSSSAEDRQYSTEAFAARLSTTPYSLTSACRRACSRSAHEIIQSALLGQATRLLLYTNRSVKEISYCLGYSHPSHFVRFFKRHRGTTPDLFRQQFASQISPDEMALVAPESGNTDLPSQES
ncbi:MULTISPECIES: AraC family transcriptional regulator [unclassified Beijerinckia]|uniref:AraC family transcriptional regulator n=1 Tax=unclassified Beijerinckia TaxID=2638183 RepID=UPI0008977AC1|nr:MULTISPECIES: AraC family transcriptional regulator [unclassified Beijerinckia]MDH7797740.1 AraC family transcriptional activator of pobA [Beijerinckia sp. GAS462]SEC97015.1 transcriptional regulator, AraC family [Beijerinckia sp. 28-YEA-48]